MGGGGFLVWDAFLVQRETRERFDAVEVRIDLVSSTNRDVAPTPQPWERPDDLVLDVTTGPAFDTVGSPPDGG